MDKLVGERSRLGVLSLGDLGEYHRSIPCDYYLPYRENAIVDSGTE